MLAFTFFARAEAAELRTLDDLSMARADDEVTIILTRDEAIVLFEFLSRYSEVPHELRIGDQAEQRVLWDMQANLESTLHEPINNSNYEQRVARARAAVRDEA